MAQEEYRKGNDSSNRKERCLQEGNGCLNREKGSPGKERQSIQERNGILNRKEAAFCTEKKRQLKRLGMQGKILETEE